MFSLGTGLPCSLILCRISLRYIEHLEGLTKKLQVQGICSIVISNDGEMNLIFVSRKSYYCNQCVRTVLQRNKVNAVEVKSLASSRKKVLAGA